MGNFFAMRRAQPLGTRDKFVLFVRDSLNPVAFLDSGFNAGLDQASNRDRAFGQGVQGYAERFAANTADQASSKFFEDFAFPVIFAEDPRYYRMAQGPFRKRLFHALGHFFRRLPRRRDAYVQLCGVARHHLRRRLEQRLSSG